jgi:uridine kinase
VIPQGEQRVKGDRLVILDRHRRAARRIVEFIAPEIRRTRGTFVLSIAGESGAGKSEIAFVVSEILSERGFRSLILQQDDYFVHPPRTNAARRREDIAHVGISEVRLEILDGNLEDIKKGRTEIEKPLVIFDEDRITTERISVRDVDVVIVEGTYTTLLKNVDRRVFIGLTRDETKEVRSQRAREEQDDFLEEILRIEHEIISKHRFRADYVVNSDYEVIVNDQRTA